jgi:hypothetical protein
MARRVFFSFHYERDIWRANQVRNSWVGRDREDAGFWDAASWESIQRQGRDAVERWINTQLDGTSVTVVLIGTETSTREYVGYEIKRSHQIGNGMLGIYIQNLRDQRGYGDGPGANPFSNWQVTINGQVRNFRELYPVYDWVANNGYQNIAAWVEAAARAAGR